MFENGVDITSAATASNSSAGNGAATSTDVEFAFATERVIAGGGSVTLELKATIGGTLVAGNSVTTKINNSTSTTVTTEDSATQALKTATFIWTDQSAPSHATTTDDWFTDGLAKTLAESQSLVY